MRGEGFVTHCSEGERVHSGQLLMDFNRDLIKDQGYEDSVVVFYTEPQELEPLAPVDQRSVKLGDSIMKVTLKKDKYTI